ncbi:heavy metal-associated isoprenylated plant protein 47-like [Fagus crenata]
MKQKIVMKVQMNCEKCRTKALKIAAEAKGVSSVAIEGADKSQVVVIGDEVDSASLTRSLRKKLGHATIVSVQELKEDAKKKPEEKEPTTLYCTQYPWQYQYPMYYSVVSDPYPSNNCTTM